MNPLYSILYYRQNLHEKINDISRLLHQGIKILWFGTKADEDTLKAQFKPFSDAFFLQAYSLDDVEHSNQYSPLEIIDGIGIDKPGEKKDLIDFFDREIHRFNVAQYQVEHCAENTNIVVTASAGTGKTTVMMDRILYLKHTVPDLDMSQIYMITFTNEATNQINDRLQEVLLKKYSLTKNQKYLHWLEQQSQMHISTIDSLAYDLFRRFGTGVGFGRDLSIRELEKERKDIVKDLLSDNLTDSRSIEDQIGMGYSIASGIIDKYWAELTRKGYTISEVLDMDWGNCGDTALATFQRVVKTVLHDFETKYSQLKLDSNSISINDLFFDFGHYLLKQKIDCDGLDMKYLFVDEFQDTDATQINTFANLVTTINARLFVVGDIKQSIYGFKGATDKAFEILDEHMNGRLKYFSLKNNYRTAANIMKTMERCFYKWDAEGLLTYDEPVRPFNPEEGSIHVIPLISKDERDYQILTMIDNALYDLELDIKSGRKKASSKSKVAVLVRGNNKAMEIADLCRDDGKVVVLTSDRPFYLSDAVRDFYAMVSSYVFPGQPIYTYNYLMSPYASFNGTLDMIEMEKLQGNHRKMMKYLNEYLKNTSWYEYQKAFRLRPVLSVIKEIVEKGDVVNHFAEMDKAKLFANDTMNEAGRNKQTYIDAKQYQANLDKLMDIIQQRMDGEFVTLYDLYVFLSLMIATNRSDMEPDVETVDDYTSVYVMTVHKSKGLEFDTVVMPAMSANIEPREDTTILVDDNKIGWIYKVGDARRVFNSQYEDLRKKQVEKGRAEETRLLYVAMTRAVNNIYMLIDNWDYHESWSGLIRKAGLPNV